MNYHREVLDRLDELIDLTCDIRRCLAHLAVSAGMDPTLVSSAPQITPDEREAAEAQEREAEKKLGS